MIPAAASEIDLRELANQSSIRQQANAALESQPAILELERTRIIDEVDRQLQIVVAAASASALIDSQSAPAAVKSSSISPEIRRIAASHENRWQVLHEPRDRRGFRFVVAMSALLLTLGLGWLGWSNFYQYFAGQDALSSRSAVHAVVERIIKVESNGDPDAKNGRSSATGPGQFVNETWLELIRTYRPDLFKGRSESKVLDLRRDTELVREIMMRFVERNVSMLRKRSLPVTPGTIYLAHFAGGAGAVALLSAPESADAALVMAAADATGRTTREQIVSANPFLKNFTVAELKIWADRKMQGAGFHPDGLLTAQEK